MEIERLALSEINLDPVNVRTHDDKNIAAIMASLKRFGQQKPIVLDHDNVVRAGNGTLVAAKELGWVDIDVVRSRLADEELVAYAIADNHSAELAEWDETGLSIQLKALDEELRDIAYPDFEFPDDPVEPSEKDDEVPDTDENEFGVKLGDVYQLGSHRLMCGDSTDKSAVDKLMDGAKVDMVFTDPPYGINEACDRVEHVKTFKNQGAAKKGKCKQIAGDESTDTAIKAIELARSLNAPCNIFWGGNYYDLKPSSCWIVWDKRVEENQSDLNSDCELAYVDHKHKASVRIFRHLWKGMIKGSEQGESRVHPTQKPIILAVWCFENYGKPKSVLDLFLGSGSTLIACEKTNRTCYGMELDPHYCSVIIKRWQDFTGKEASLVRD